MTRPLAPSRPAGAWLPARTCGQSARNAYESLAPVYDRFTAGYAYERVLDLVEALALEHGLRGRRLLDVGCGTGRSFEPMLARGYDVHACDISPAMVRRARVRLRGHGEGGERAFVADMRALPDRGRHDLVTCLDDAVNYLHAIEDLDAAFACAARALAPGGIYVFDVNALRTYRTAFAGALVHEDDGLRVDFLGEATPDVAPGALCSARIHVRRRTQRRWRRRTCVHVQRHWPVAVVAERLAFARFGPVRAHGLLPGPRLDGPPDELRHHKVLFVATALGSTATTPTEGGRRADQVVTRPQTGQLDSQGGLVDLIKW